MYSLDRASPSQGDRATSATAMLPRGDTAGKHWSISLRGPTNIVRAASLLVASFVCLLVINLIPLLFEKKAKRNG